MPTSQAHHNLQSNCYQYYHLNAPTTATRHKYLRSCYGALSVELGTCEDSTATLETLRTAIRDVLTWHLRELDVSLRNITHHN